MLRCTTRFRMQAPRGIDGRPFRTAWVSSRPSAWRLYPGKLTIPHTEHNSGVKEMSAYAPTSAAAGSGSDRSFFTGGMAALAGLMFGLDIGVISGALGFIGTAFHASDSAKE